VNHTNLTLTSALRAAEGETAGVQLVLYGPERRGHPTAISDPAQSGSGHYGANGGLGPVRRANDGDREFKAYAI
jgi:hypothetical protein